MSALPFVEFPKIARLKRDIVITEKLDGTNAQVSIRPVVDQPYDDNPGLEHGYDIQVGDLLVRAGSRNRWISPADDNYGFARWVYDHAHALATMLGVGSHFGEWWGAGIQRRYGLAGNDKRYSLFNTARWAGVSFPIFGMGVVPVLYQGPMIDTDPILSQLRAQGSIAVPGFMAPEGIVIYHQASRTLFKQTLDKDEQPKGAA